MKSLKIKHKDYDRNKTNIYTDTIFENIIMRLI